MYEKERSEDFLSPVNRNETAYYHSIDCFISYCPNSGYRTSNRFDKKVKFNNHNHNVGKYESLNFIFRLNSFVFR
jgi:hypothetical protein